MMLKNYLSTLADLLNSSKNFNSLSVVNKDGVVLATSPELGIVGSETRYGWSEQKRYLKEKTLSPHLIKLQLEDCLF